MSHFFAYLSRMKHIKRWGLMRNAVEENIKEHSLDTAIIAHGLAMIRNNIFGGNVDAGKVAELAMFHEVGEIMTGDIATPIKYYSPEIKQAFGEIEQFANKRILAMLPEELIPAYEGLILHDNNPLYILVKAADKLCAYIKCLEEQKCGNHEFDKAVISIEAQLKEMQLPEVDYFMAHFIKSYTLTLDELN